MTEPPGDQEPQPPAVPPPPLANQAEGGTPPPQTIEQYAEFYSSFHAGAVAPPDIAKQWGELVPDAPQQILTLTMDEAGHRHWMDRMFVYFRFASLLVAAIVAMTAILGGIYLAAHDKPGTGLAIILADLVAVLAVFLVRQYRLNGQRGS